jgi:hypothetical protein
MGNIERSIVSINRRLNCQGKWLAVPNELSMLPYTSWRSSLCCSR